MTEPLWVRAERAIAVAAMLPVFACIFLIPKGCARLCQRCHTAVHAEFTNLELIYTDWSEVVRRVRVRLALVVTKALCASQTTPALLLPVR